MSEFRVLGEPTATEGRLVPQVGHAVLGSIDPAIEPMGSRFGVDGPVPGSLGLGACRRDREATPPVPLSSTDVWSVQLATFG
jgi:hypothetical protein